MFKIPLHIIHPFGITGIPTLDIPEEMLVSSEFAKIYDALTGYAKHLHTVKKHAPYSTLLNHIPKLLEKIALVNKASHARCQLVGADHEKEHYRVDFKLHNDTLNHYVIVLVYK